MTLLSLYLSLPIYLHPTVYKIQTITQTNIRTFYGDSIVIISDSNRFQYGR